MTTILRDKDGDLMDFISKPNPEDSNTFLVTTPQSIDIIATKRSANIKKGVKAMSEVEWHKKLRVTYMKRGWVLVKGTILLNIDAKYNTFEINQN